MIIPRKQTCCSIPMLYHGGVEEARANILTNIECLQHEDAVAILVDCPTCGSALTKEFPAMMRKFGGDAAAADRVAAKTTDLMAFIRDRFDQLGSGKNEARDRLKVSYHLPCHLKNAAGSSEDVLRLIPGLDYVAASDIGNCCGGGGTFFYEYPEVSGKMAAAKIANFRETGATVWLTDCPVCRINLAGQLGEEEEVSMMHPATLLAKLLKDDHRQS